MLNCFILPQLKHEPQTKLMLSFCLPEVRSGGDTRSPQTHPELQITLKIQKRKLTRSVCGSSSSELSEHLPIPRWDLLRSVATGFRTSGSRAHRASAPLRSGVALQRPAASSSRSADRTGSRGGSMTADLQRHGLFRPI